MNYEGKAENAPEKTGTEKPLSFKKPLLIGKVGRFPRKIVNNENTDRKEVQNVSIDDLGSQPSTDEVNAVCATVVSSSSAHVEEVQGQNISYKEPPWSGLPQCENKEYAFEVLKSGAVIENVNLMTKPYWVFGRLGTCDICMAHPTISRFHAILQYRSEPGENYPTGFYLYDLASTHGTFLNKSRLKTRVYVRVQVGHMIKFGCSSRTYLLTGPDDDTEEESELSITELKKRRVEELQRRKEVERQAELKVEQEKEAKQKLLEEKGVDWGMGEDADEETDLAENPFAQTNNEDLYLDDPKKALRGFMEREGYNLDYDCTEQGMGQFLCKVELPLDDEKGRPIVAEVLHRGKKKEAVVQCALEACRILDRYGLLRQATHESRKRKVKNWEENDFYDSDDDTFLDRTGIIEKKRENRMKAKIPQQPETYQSLIDKQKKLSEEIATIEQRLSGSNWQTRDTTLSNAEEDPLDSFMKELKQSKLDKQKISKLKSDLNKLKQEYSNIIKLVNIVKPVDLPPLLAQEIEVAASTNASKCKLPLYGKRLKVKVQLPTRPQTVNMSVDDDDEEEDKVDKEEADSQTNNKAALDEPPTLIKTSSKMAVKGASKSLVNVSIKRLEFGKPKVSSDDRYSYDCNRIETSLKKIFPLMTTAHEEQVTKIWRSLQMLNKNSSSDKKREVLDLFQSYLRSVNALIGGELSGPIQKLTTSINNANTADAITDMGGELINVVKEVTHLVNKMDRLSQASETQVVHEKEAKSGDTVEMSEEEVEKRKRKNQRRVQQRQERAEIEKQRGYAEDASKEDYNMWVPPEGQTGDGRTSLNEKLGY